jgi:prevent-host-death family protein
MHNARGTLGKLVDEALAGKEVILARSGRPVARIVPLNETPRPRKLGALVGKIKLPDDFDAAQPEAPS